MFQPGISSIKRTGILVNITNTTEPGYMSREPVIINCDPPTIVYT